MAHPIVFVKEEESPKCTVFVKEEESPKCTVCLTLKLCIKKPLALPPDFHLFMEVRNTLFHNVSFLREQEWYNKLMIGPDSSFAQWTRNLQFEFGKLTQQHCNLLGVSLLHNKKNEMPGIQLHSFTMHEWRFCGTTKHKTLHNILDCRSRDAVFRTIRDAAAKGHTSVQPDKDLFNYHLSISSCCLRRPRPDHLRRKMIKCTICGDHTVQHRDGQYKLLQMDS